MIKRLSCRELLTVEGMLSWSQDQEKTGGFAGLYLYLMPRGLRNEHGSPTVKEAHGVVEVRRHDYDRRKSPWDNRLRPHGAPPAGSRQPEPCHVGILSGCLRLTPRIPTRQPFTLDSHHPSLSIRGTPVPSYFLIAKEKGFQQWKKSCGTTPSVSGLRSLINSTSKL